MISQSGNVLFLILLAVALFAALSYAITSQRSGGADASSENNKTNAAATLAHIASLQSAVQKLRIVNGCTENQLNFANPIYKSGHGTLSMQPNVNAPASGKCDVYSSKGGNIVPYQLPLATRGVKDGSNGVVLPGNADLKTTQYKNIGTDAPSGTESANDLAIQFYRPTKEACMALNDALGITNPSGFPPVVTTLNGAHGDNYPNGSFAADGITSGTNIDGNMSFCSSAGGRYTFTSILLAR